MGPGIGSRVSGEVRNVEMVMEMRLGVMIEEDEIL
jgi:hypothetical protein